MKMSLRNALVVALFVSAASFALAAPGGGAPQPQVSHLSSVSIAIAAFLSLLGF
jgi:hypothetical protein